MKRIMYVLITAAGLLWSNPAFISPATAEPLIKLPETPIRSCRRGRAKLYDECSNQKRLFAAALDRANAEGKTLLVSYGAEWCIWCHVFDAYLNGEKSRFSYKFASPDAPNMFRRATLYEREKSDVSAKAAALQNFAANNFVLVHIDAQYAPRGDAVLKRTRALAHYNGGLPFIFTVNKSGRYAAHLFYNRVETRRDSTDWYRGYNRQKLIAELKRVKAAAQR